MKSMILKVGANAINVKFGVLSISLSRTVILLNVAKWANNATRDKRQNLRNPLRLKSENDKFLVTSINNTDIMTTHDL